MTIVLSAVCAPPACSSLYSNVYCATRSYCWLFRSISGGAVIFEVCKPLKEPKDPPSHHHPALPVSSCKSRFWGLPMVSVVSSARYQDIRSLPAALIPLCQLGLFHPPLPAWRSSSCQSRFAFIHMMNEIVGEPLSPFLSRPLSHFAALRLIPPSWGLHP